MIQLLLLALLVQDPAPRYAVVVKKSTAEDESWSAVVEALKKKYSARVFVYGDMAEEVRKKVGAYVPRYVCFVVKPTADFPALVTAANRFCRTLDDDPYVDAIWGVLTGWDAEHARELVGAKPISIKSGFMKTAMGWLTWMKEGCFFTEDMKNRGEMGMKTTGEPIEKTRNGPKTDGNDARRTAEEINRDVHQLYVGSGHGNHNEWMLMYPRGRAFLRARKGRLVMEGPGVNVKVNGVKPKVYWAVGNCLTGLVNDGRHSFRDSYALAWMRNGVKQYIGATKSTWYGTNWSMVDWFLKQQGRWTFSESLFLLRQWARHRVAEGMVKGKDREGTIFTDDIFVLYGDPAVEARVEKERDPALSESLQVTKDGDRVRIEYRVTRNKGGAQNFATLLPFHVSDVKEEKNTFEKVVHAGETLIWHADADWKEGEERTVVFTARRTRP